LKCGPIWTRSQIISKLRVLYAKAGGAMDDEAAFEEWAVRRSLARAQELGFNDIEAKELLSL
jgi:hypothetical protein